MSHLTLVPKNEHFIREVFTDFLLSREAMLCSPATLDFYKYTAGKFVTWLVKKSISNPEDILSSHVRAYLASLRSRNLKANTIHSHARAIKTFLRFCHQENYIPCHVKFEMPRVPNKAMPLLNPKQIKQVMRACRSIKHKALVYVLLDTGLRRAETSKPCWGDVDINSGIVRVSKGKGGKSRSVVIGVKTRRILLRYRRNVPNAISDSVFNLSGHGIRSALRRIGERVGIRLTAHMFRRTFATLSIKNGMNPLHLQGLLGHSSLEIVRRYIQILDGDLMQAHREYGPVDKYLK